MPIDFGNKVPTFQEFKDKLGYGNASGKIEDLLGQQYNKTFGKEESNGSNANWYQQLFQSGSNFVNQGTGNFQGPEYNYLVDYLKNVMNSGLPNKQQLFQQGKKEIGNVTNQNIQNTKANLASSGNLRSGAGQNVLASIYGGQAGAESNLMSNLNQQEQDYIQNAIGRLTGLNTFAGSQALSERGQNYNMAQFLQSLSEGGRLQDWQNTYNQPTFWDYLGSILGQAGGYAGGKALSAVLGL